MWSVMECIKNVLGSDSNTKMREAEKVARLGVLGHDMFLLVFCAFPTGWYDAGEEL
jgi:hypothetical protein